jgi:hypothetical protein
MNRRDRMKWEQQIYHQRGESIMPQGVLPYTREEEKTQAGMTALAGLPVYLDLASVLGLGSISVSTCISRNGDGPMDRHYSP